MTQRIDIKYPGMNKFIELTDLTNNQPIQINSQMIMCIETGPSGGSILGVAFMNDKRIIVKESPKEILKMIG